ncbi:sensor histidine kinase [Streptomyces spiramenti]|uniref:histidine kinase n=1 Tax=Streptomyces spiramenti TaxID=2720606 RepID=A0ABX1ASU6_9ACTN|nr:sensor histidine kinase [Streptomyces spiramenti]NJP67310.1 sensor histidine kinase [Streptomyces spiramenti]
MSRIHALLRRHPVPVDAAWSLPIVVLSSWLVLRYDSPHYPGGPAWAGLLVVATAWAAVAVRRTAPGPAMWLTVATVVLHVLGAVAVVPTAFLLLVVVHTAAAGPLRWASRTALVLALTAPWLQAARWAVEGDPGSFLVEGCVLTALAVVPWVLGDSARTRRAYFAELETRAARLERERELEARVAVAAERTRIARELHDVVAHSVSVMVVQADGALYTIPDQPARTREAVRAVSTTGRQALAEMRRLVGVLRDAAEEESVDADRPGAPQPGLEQVESLVEEVRAAGLDVSWTLAGVPRAVPEGVALTAYRLIQEALTNTRKHAGPGATADVTLRYTEAGVELTAEDDGRGPAARDVGRRADGGGNGLVGMRERVALVGGRVSLGPRPGGGYRVAAVLPAPAAVPNPATVGDR